MGVKSAKPAGVIFNGAVVVQLFFDSGGGAIDRRATWDFNWN
jgi:hypothetical protein